MSTSVCGQVKSIDKVKGHTPLRRLKIPIQPIDSHWLHINFRMLRALQACLVHFLILFHFFQQEMYGNDRQGIIINAATHSDSEVLLKATQSQLFNDRKAYCNIN